ncbi:MAG: winged helix-turn-helix transcriptional regulator, partial [Chloroflexi bacterium]|nr:winged helix-turn-helix transcriptional regulator [Chloroflexota bacterium]
MTIFKPESFRPSPDTPLYQQLYTHLRAAILSGELKRGLKLPSTRALADELNLSRNTVLNAYRQLLAEGYLEGHTGSGTFVADVLPEHLLTTPDRKRSTTP